MTIVKICGLKDPENAVVAADAGADLIGVVFVEGVRRNVSLPQAEQIVSAFSTKTKIRMPKSVGLFADQSLEFVNMAVEKCQLDYVQLCGEETLDYCTQVEAQVIRQYKVNESYGIQRDKERIIRDLDQISESGCMPLLDRFEHGSLGGTGKTFDWALIDGISDQIDFMLAGGLTSDNVGFAIKSVSPWGVDVSTGVETEQVKDATKIIEFIDVARSILD